MSLQYELSYWEWKSFLAGIDVAIIGGGLVGMQTALALHERRPEWKIVILERGPLSIGASTRNAGFACFGSVTELIDDLKHTNEAEVWDLVERRYRGLEQLRRQFLARDIRFRWSGGYEIFSETDAATYAECMERLPYFNRQLTRLTGTQFTFRSADTMRERLGLHHVSHLIINVGEGQLDTGRLMRNLWQRVQRAGILLLSGTTALDYTETTTGVEIATNWGWSVPAERLIIANNAFAADLVAGLPVHPARNQVLLTAPLPGLRLRGCFHYQQGYVYLRNVGNRLLIGGGRHLDISGERTATLGSHPGIRIYLHRLLQHWLQQPAESLPIDHAWSGIIGTGDHKSPLVRSLSERVMAGVRLGGMGVALSAQVAQELAQQLIKR